MSDVYKTIALIQGELAKTGISKDGVNSAQNYKFRGIDQVYGALAPLLSKHGLCILPRMVSREMHERVSVKEYQGSKKESVLFYVTVEAEFDFVAVSDGTMHTIRTYGEAMDSGDKGTNKAMSAAYKYAAFMAFAIPTEGDNDADATTHEVAPRDEPAPREKLEGKHTSKSALQAALREYGAKIGKAMTPREVDAIDRDYADDLEQGKKYLPAWMAGDGTAEKRGLTKLTEQTRALLELVESMNAMDSKKTLENWMGANELLIERLDDAERRRFEKAYEIRETEINTMDKSSA